MKTINKILAALALTLPFYASAKTTEITIDGDHGKLAAILQVPENKTAYPMVILMHGFTSNKEYELFSKTADRLEENGIASIRFDFNGHGESEGRFEDMTVLNDSSFAVHY